MPGEKRTAPCATCPYRRETKLGLWSREEFTNLQQQNANEYGGAEFGCHSDSSLKPKDRDVCVGWLLDQRRHGVPSIKLRLRLMTNDDLCQRFNTIDETVLDLYGSVDEMLAANYPEDSEADHG